MKSFIHWTTSAYSAEDPSAPSSNSLILVNNVQRYLKFYSGYSMKVPLKGNLPYRIDNQYVEIPPGRYFLANCGREMECLPCQPGGETLFVNFSPAKNRIAIVKFFSISERIFVIFFRFFPQEFIEQTIVPQLVKPIHPFVGQKILK